ncbi:MAG: hypothetical protein J2P53_17680 [Bradyrhizobiaceae bacterium]|nr:hypothetical protein [Bradyrhizobiaceae bacterium]
MSNTRTIARLRFPPWQVYELQGGYAVEDAEGRRLGTFYGKPDPVEARQAGVLTLEEARQTAFDFARLVELLNRSLDAETSRKPAPAQTPVDHPYKDDLQKSHSHKNDLQRHRSHRKHPPRTRVNSVYR